MRPGYVAVLNICAVVFERRLCDGSQKRRCTQDPSTYWERRINGDRCKTLLKEGK